jgi:E3 ubiquitin-protein ligase RFWD2
MGIKELDSLMTLVAEKKKQMEQQDSETNMQILLVFLHCLRKQKLDELNEVCLSLVFCPSDSLKPA